MTIKISATNACLIRDNGEEVEFDWNNERDRFFLGQAMKRKLGMIS